MPAAPQPCPRPPQDRAAEDALHPSDAAGDGGEGLRRLPRAEAEQAQRRGRTPQRDGSHPPHQLPGRESPCVGLSHPHTALHPSSPPLPQRPTVLLGLAAGVCASPCRRCAPGDAPPTVRVSSRPSISARSASGPPCRPSRWSLTQARPTCGCRPTSAPPSTAPVVSVGAQPQPQSVPAHSSIRRGAQRGLGGGLPCTGLSVCCLAGCPLVLGQGGFIIPWMPGDQRPSASPASLSLMHHLPLPSFPQPLRLLQVPDVHRQQHGLRYPLRERERQRLPQPGHRHGEDMPRICRPGATGSARRCLRAALLPHMSIPSQPGAGGLAGGFSPLQGHLCPSLGVRHPHHPGLR